MQSNPPETKYEISFNELHAAMSAGSFKARSWFYKATRNEIFQDKELRSYIGWLDNDEELEYVVLKEAKCVFAEPTYLVLDKIGDGFKRRGFIFYNSVLPDILVRESLTLDWLLIHTRIQDIKIESNSRIGDINIRENSQAGSITISGDCKAGHIRIEKNSKAGDISIYSKSRCGDIDIHEYTQVEAIYFDDDSQAGTIRIKNYSKCAAFNVRESKIGTLWVEENSEIIYIGVYASQCESIFVVKKGQVGPMVIGDSKISHVHFYQGKGLSIGIAEGVECEGIEIAGNSLVGRVQIRGGHVKEVVIENNYCAIFLLNAHVPIMRVLKCHIQELKWQAGTRAELYITDSLINHLNLNNTALSKEAVLSIADCSIYIIQLQDLIILGLLILRNVRGLKESFLWQPGAKRIVEGVADDYFYHDIDQGVYKEHQDDTKKLEETFRKRPLFLIANSSLGKTEITGSDLELFRLEYRDSRLLEIFLSGTKLPATNIYCPSDDPLPPRELFEQKVAIYNQLKRIFDNQGDIVEAAQYHARAMDSQRNLLQLVYREKHQPKWYSVNKWFTDEGFDLFNFRLNRLSNNHGESWRRAVGFIICISLFFYTCYYISLNYYKPFMLTWATFGHFIGNYFAFFDLTHKMDFMADKSELNATAKFLDFVGRIAIGYSVYQLIVSFRRHGRK